MKKAASASVLRPVKASHAERKTAAAESAKDFARMARPAATFGASHRSVKRIAEIGFAEMPASRSAPRITAGSAPVERSACPKADAFRVRPTARGKSAAQTDAAVHAGIALHSTPALLKARVDARPIAMVKSAETTAVAETAETARSGNAARKRAHARHVHPIAKTLNAGRSQTGAGGAATAARGGYVWWKTGAAFQTAAEGRAGTTGAAVHAVNVECLKPVLKWRVSAFHRTAARSHISAAATGRP